LRMAKVYLVFFRRPCDSIAHFEVSDEQEGVQCIY
jgi:hypothetical protein